MRVSAPRSWPCSSCLLVGHPNEASVFPCTGRRGPTEPWSTKGTALRARVSLYRRPTTNRRAQRCSLMPIRTRLPPLRRRSGGADHLAHVCSRRRLHAPAVTHGPSRADGRSVRPDLRWAKGEVERRSRQRSPLLGHYARPGTEGTGLADWTRDETRGRASSCDPIHASSRILQLRGLRQLWDGPYGTSQTGRQVRSPVESAIRRPEQQSPVFALRGQAKYCRDLEVTVDPSGVT